MVKHIVFWTFGPEADERSVRDTALEMRSRLEALNGRIPGLLSLEVGLDFSRGARSADVALHSEFSDRQALETYQTHPEHMAVAGYIGALGLERHVVDYEV